MLSLMHLFKCYLSVLIMGRHQNNIELVVQYSRSDFYNGKKDVLQLKR